MKQRLIYIIGVLLLLLSPVRSEAQISYQYWIDNDTGSAVSGTTTDGASLSLNIDVAALSPGVHFYNIRARQGVKWGTVYRYIFSIPRESNAASSQLKNYEYWLDNDYEHRVLKAGTGSELTVTSALDVSSLSPGVHFFNLRAQDARGAWGSTQRSLFCIPREQNESTSRLITGYRYGFDDDLTTVTLTSPVSEYTLVKILDAPDPSLPMTIDDDCHFSFSDEGATLLRNVEMSFVLTFTDEAEAMSSPVGTSFTVTDTRTCDILSLSVPGTLAIPAHATGGYTVMKFEIPSAGSYVMKSTSACSLRLYSSEGALLDAVDADVMTAGYSRDYEEGTYYAVAFGNAAATTLSITVADADMLKPTLTYADDVVTISSSLPSATLYYTLDGSDPTTASTLYEAPIPVDRNLTVKAIASWTGFGVSPVAMLELDLFTVAKPEISHEDDVVTISTATEGASIYYTIDGTEPTAESTAYTEPFTVTKNCTIKVIALRDGYHDSEVETFVVDWLRVADVTFTQDGSKLTLATTTEGATIMYKVASEDYSSEGEWTVYNGVLNLEGSYHVEAYATKDGYYDSWITECLFIYFRPTVSAPQITHDEDLISITCGTEEATIYYTMDGSDPTTESNVYTESFTVTENCTIKAFAVKNGFIDSEITSLTVDWIVPDGVCGYAELNSETGTLTFKYGIMPEGENVWNTDDTNFSYINQTPWDCSKLKKVVFDPSYAKTRPKSTAYWFHGAKELANITGIEFLNTSNVTDMGWMFSMCSGLTSLDVTHFDTGNVADMDSMFYSCSGLTSLDVTHFDTGNVTNMKMMFYRCSGLKSLDVSHFDTGNVTNMFCMFASCPRLASLDVTHFDTGNVTNMHGMFSNCSGLTSLDVTHFDTGNVTDMGWMFNSCSGLTSLDVSHFDTGNVTDMGLMFSNCSGLTSLDVTHFDTGNVTDMRQMFYSCSGLTSLDVTHFDTGNVTDMRQMFYSCSGLTSLDVTHFDTGNVTDMRDMFYNCSKLSRLSLSNFDTSNVRDMGNMFSGCSGLTSLDVSNFVTVNVKRMDGMFYNCSKLSSLSLSNFDTSSVTEMGYYFYRQYISETTYWIFSGGNGMFAGCSALTSLDLSSFRTSNVTCMGRMFSGCTSLKYLDISNFDTQNVIDMREMFAMCYSLENLDVSKFNTGKVTNMSCMFYCCNSLSALNVSKFDTGKVTDMSFMFDGCNSLTSLDVSGFNTINVTNMMGMFQYCANVTNLDVSNFDTGNVTEMGAMFSHCVSLENLNVAKFNTSKVTDMNCMFELCNKLTNLNLSNFNTANVTDMNRMFYLCNGLTNLNVCSFNTSKVKDMRFMFSDCNNLKKLDLSSFDTSSVTTIDSLFSSGGATCLLYWWKTALGSRHPAFTWTTQSSILETIYVSDSWSMANVTSSDNLFNGCTKLVGGMGTRFYTSNDGLSYARIDGGTSAPGYFTEKKLLLGDAYGDGVVDQLDVDAIAHYIIGDDVADFDHLAADANEDGKINVADITVVVNIIRNSAATRSSAVRQMNTDEDRNVEDRKVVHYTVEAQCLNPEGVPADAEVNDHTAPVVKMITVSE